MHDPQFIIVSNCPPGAALRAMPEHRQPLGLGRQPLDAI
jgi:hypothetical protein